MTDRKRHLLGREASGLRHLRWAREVVGTLVAHYEHHPSLEDDARAFLLDQSVELRAAVERLSMRVKPYRDFLERKRTAMRGMVRVGRYLVAEAKTAEEKADASLVKDGFDEAFANFDARERLPLKKAVTAAIDELRGYLTAMDARIEARLGSAFLQSLYPELDETRSFIVDDGDPDDDAVV
jgi:hypothetical protein